MPSRITLIAGLGNPGLEYANTRHNAGFWLADRLVHRFHACFSMEKKLFSELARIQTDDHDLRVIKPQTFMNESGRAVAAAADYYAINSDEILIVHDEIDLPAGIIKLKHGGGHGGHNGLRSISQHLPDCDYCRLRIGVSHPGSKQDVTSHVLGRPTAQDKKRIDSAIQRGLDCMDRILAGDISQAMCLLHAEKPAG